VTLLRAAARLGLRHDSEQVHALDREWHTIVHRAQLLMPWQCLAAAIERCCCLW
jgi:hypothetical protein